MIPLLSIFQAQLPAGITQSAGNAIGATAGAISGNFSWLIVGIVLFVIAALLFYHLKNLIVNTILGIIGWGILTYAFHVQLPFWASLIVSAIFGLAGLGVMVVLAFLGIVH